jgi:hypothetical protein
MTMSLKWQHLDVDGEMGVGEGIPCAGCSEIVHDLIFYPRDWDDAEAQRILQSVRTMRVDNIGDPSSLGFCGECKSGLEEIARSRQQSNPGA